MTSCELRIASHAQIRTADSGVCYFLQAEIRRKLLALNLPLVNNNFSENADTFDAFVRDALGPWLYQLAALHERLEEILNINHEPESRSSIASSRM